MIVTLPDAALREAEARRFCRDFLAATTPRLILGRNCYSDALLKLCSVDGMIDDFTTETIHRGVPVVRSETVPAGALVINAAGGRPLSARQRLRSLGVRNLDYFAFRKYAGLALPEIVFNEGFAADHAAHAEAYAWLDGILADEESRWCLHKLVNFRVSQDIEHLAGFIQREEVQYFEPFLALRPSGEVFLDVGAYDGATSLAFIGHCPDYRAIHCFEPEAGNLERCAAALAGHPNVHFHPFGLSDVRRQVRLTVDGSASRIVDAGENGDVWVEALDDLAIAQSSFIKIDTEGFEAAALAGAARTIARDRPRLAVAVYHRAGDFWRIPRQILALRPDYKVYFRHYTESIYETVAFFV